MFCLNWPMDNGLVWFGLAFLAISFSVDRSYHEDYDNIVEKVLSGNLFFLSSPQQINFLIVSKGKFERPTANQIVWKNSNSPFVSKYYQQISIQMCMQTNTYSSVCTFVRTSSSENWWLHTIVGYFYPTSNQSWFIDLPSQCFNVRKNIGLTHISFFDLSPINGFWVSTLTT